MNANLIFVAALLPLSFLPETPPAQDAAPPAAAVAPCEADAEFRRFDFWVGDWDVFVGEKLVGRNKIDRILSGCVVYENWKSTGAFEGKSFNVYSPRTKQWRQVWVDNSGLVLDLSGEFRDGAMRLAGETTARDGSKVLHRLTFYPLAGGKVRQHWEQSRDAGKTWTDAFDGTYVRRTQP